MQVSGVSLSRRERSPVTRPAPLPLLSLTGIRKRFGERLALDSLTLRLERGEVLGLLGPNGAGKSTLVACVVGLLRPDQGEVRFDSRPLDRRALARIGVAPQELALYPDLSGEENLRFFARLYGLRGARLRERVDYALDFVGLSERRRGRVDTWSGGMQRRLNLAVAIVHDPDLVILDEPTVGVDPQSRNRLLENVERLRDADKAVIYTTHYMEEAQRLCDRVCVMDRGRLLAAGSVEGLIAEHGGHPVVVAELPGGELRIESADPIATLSRLRREEGEVRGFRLEAPNLEQVFLNLTGRGLRD